MKKWILAAVLLCAGVGAAAADVGVSVNIGDPNFYGRITIGNYPPPQLIYPQPVVIMQPRAYYEPLYLRVPPGHARNWGRYCGRYSACGRPVYFVRDSWYRNVYAPRYRSEHWQRHGHDRWDDDDRRHGGKRGHDRYRHGRDD
ncbi:hypothetical protein [Chitinilyticum aquatile]|uniref:hypothetical protein n=1 Tax=Chitinilyticum aquatile TaxID=362520 RepID=UPI00040914D0|nr:hypothetical protein [Chitinilyticum aquatile]